MASKEQPIYFVFVEENNKKIWRGETRRATPPATFNDDFVCQTDEFDFEPLPLRDDSIVIVDLEKKSTYYKLIDNQTEELSKIRSIRDTLLNECDLKYCNAEKWELMTELQKQDWREYKQALRDLPQNYINSGLISYPVKPI
jgi:hypothetical protein